MQFIYLYEDANLHSVLTQAVGAASMCWSETSDAGDFDINTAFSIVDAANVEIRRLITFELSSLLDGAGVAVEWNDAIEAAIQRVEAMT